MKNLLRVLGLKTILVMLTDLTLVSIGLFAGVLSALAFDRAPWGTEFWVLSLICIVCNLGTAIISWWAWIQLRFARV